MPAHRPRLELVWPGKDQFLLTPSGPEGRPVWVEPDHPAAHEVRLTEFTGAHGQVNQADPHADNLLFTGDSLDVLRVLCEVPEYRQHYRGKVKLIYLDPPFNTGQTFAHYDDWMEHSTWLSFMRDRLLLMKELLSPEGSIWVHLDDAEVHRMRCILDEIFGSQSFVAAIQWQKLYARKSNTSVSTSHDTILFYAREPKRLRVQLLPPTPDLLARYKNPDGDPRGPWQSVSFHVRTDNPERRVEYRYEIELPSGRKVAPPPGRHWNGKRERYDRLVADRMLYFGPDGDSVPRLKMFLDENALGLVPNTWWTRDEVGDNNESKVEVRDLFPEQNDVFQTPKPERLLQRVLGMTTSPGDIVLDPFAGSGTTAAVAQKMGRRWVTAELSQATVDRFIVPRLTKVVDGDDPGGISEKAGWEGGGGFRTVTVGPSMYEATPVGVMLADWATNGKFSRAVAGQLGFTFQPDAAPLCGVRGRMRLAVLDGAVGPEEIREIVAALGDSERVTVVAKVILPGAEEALAEVSRGSKIRKAPRDLLTDDIRRVKRRRSQSGGTAT